MLSVTSQALDHNIEHNTIAYMGPFQNKRNTVCSTFIGEGEGVGERSAAVSSLGHIYANTKWGVYFGTYIA